LTLAAEMEMHGFPCLWGVQDAPDPGSDVRRHLGACDL